MPATDSVKLDVYDKTKNSLISIAKAINAPIVIFISNTVASDSMEFGILFIISINAPPENVFQKMLMIRIRNVLIDDIAASFIPTTNSYLQNQLLTEELRPSSMVAYNKSYQLDCASPTWTFA